MSMICFTHKAPRYPAPCQNGIFFTLGIVQTLENGWRLSGETRSVATMSARVRCRLESSGTAA